MPFFKRFILSLSLAFICLQSVLSYAQEPFDQTIVGTNNQGEAFEQLVGSAGRDVDLHPKVAHLVLLTKFETN
ncbi:hypothetical protein [Reinekea sp.]|jgi:hypothetical protein|uniref:hypothetical protein n=1 Tax=Reinekea sp. TaxID=1970455 RepID=UPI003989D675